MFSWSNVHASWSDVRQNLSQLLRVLALAHSPSVKAWSIADVQESVKWCEYYRQVRLVWQLLLPSSVSLFKLGPAPVIRTLINALTLERFGQHRTRKTEPPCASCCGKPGRNHDAAVFPHTFFRA
jgi:hypothetical protein